VGLSRLLWTMSDIFKVSDGSRVEVKWFRSDFDTLLLGKLYMYMGMEKYTTFSTKRIVALRSVNKIFPESYDFAAMLVIMLYN
jgi:hypothetical protein